MVKHIFAHGCIMKGIPVSNLQWNHHKDFLILICQLKKLRLKDFTLFVQGHRTS